MTAVSWVKCFAYDPVTPLLESGNPAVIYFTRRDLLQEPVRDLSEIWALDDVRDIIKRQTADGHWLSKSANKAKHPAQNYDLLETFRFTNILVNQYGLNRSHPCIERAAEYLFSCQTDEGDIRGIIGEQYAPYYNGIIVANLNRSGYEDDPRVKAAMNWLLSMRQNDGGWVIGSPGCMGTYSREERDALTTQFVGTRRDFDRDQPFGHAGTGMVIRGFVTHSFYSTSPEAKQAGQLLADSLFKRNNHSSYQHPDNWLRFQYPFWWTDLVSALDSLSLLGFTLDHPRITQALDWLVENQTSSGLWKHSYSKIHKAAENAKTRELQLWVSLSILRACKILLA